MTAPTDTMPHFTALAALATARRADLAPEELGVYCTLLADLRPVSVAEACTMLGKQARQAFEPAMPDVGAIRAAVAAVEAAHRAELRASRLLPAPTEGDPRTWVHCTDCGDTGQALRRCPGVGATAPDSGRDAYLRPELCARRFDHAPHSFADRCRCWDTNPVLARRRAAASRTTTAA